MPQGPDKSPIVSLARLVFHRHESRRVPSGRKAHPFQNEPQGIEGLIDASPEEWLPGFAQPGILVAPVIRSLLLVVPGFETTSNHYIASRPKSVSPPAGFRVRRREHHDRSARGILERSVPAGHRTVPMAPRESGPHRLPRASRRRGPSKAQRRSIARFTGSSRGGWSTPHRSRHASDPWDAELLSEPPAIRRDRDKPKPYRERLDRSAALVVLHHLSGVDNPHRWDLSSGFGRPGMIRLI